jgi:hypothetical protein
MSQFLTEREYTPFLFLPSMLISLHTALTVLSFLYSFFSGAAGLRGAVTALDSLVGTFVPLTPPAVRSALRLTILSLRQAVNQQSGDFAHAVSIRHAIDEDNEDSVLPPSMPSRGLRD